MIRKPEDLEVYRRSYEQALRLHKLSLGFPEFERYELSRQLREASKSIPVNIAEGYGKKDSGAEFRRFLNIAHGSCEEVKVWLQFCVDLGYLAPEQGEELLKQYDDLGKMLYGLMKHWK